MTVRLTLDEFVEQFQESGAKELPCDPTDKLDRTLKFNLPFSQGWSRRIILGEGIRLEINQNQIRDQMTIISPEIADSYISLEFLLSGNEQWKIASATGDASWTITAGEYMLCSSGSRNFLVNDYDINPFSVMWIEIDQKVLRSFAASLEGELPKYLQHLIGPISREIHRRSGNIQPKMAIALQQILHCPYQGMIKRAYLESKAVELLALVLADEATVQQGKVKQLTLKPEQIERIHYAREILLRDMYNPPSLAELAHQVGLSNFLLKKGFQQVFGTTVFGELQAYRLELAKQLLAEGNLSAAEIGRLAGYANPSSFAKAFRKKFGVTPTAYRKSCRLT